MTDAVLADDIPAAYVDLVDLAEQRRDGWPSEHCEWLASAVWSKCSSVVCSSVTNAPIAVTGYLVAGQLCPERKMISTEDHVPTRRWGHRQAVPPAPDHAVSFTTPALYVGEQIGRTSVSRLRKALLLDSTRKWISVGATLVAGCLFGIVAGITPSGRVVTLPFIATVYLGAWLVYCLVYCGLTWSSLRRLDGEELRVLLLESSLRRRRRQWTEWLVASGGTAGAVTFCAFAIAAVISVAAVRELRQELVVIVLAALVVASSWLLIVVVYALHYARENANLGGIEFEGPDEVPNFSDFLYLAVQVGTTFSGSDVRITSRAMRATVTANSCVAFVFNTVTIALLISLLIAVVV
ncbi:DUF1345 domain-containing protein [Micromonospora sp. WMMD1082]|uniref:DUF1345 domain-containing protein n=1 Tax=Micromonospora sp. WMMD1082 TaxID=3016104 RepID=UPI002417B8DB|nr:DUF1345 domain-containing protein [Micromonospora sp. WMMD1082]MDG4794420.1 DUF1345 domain-containing protein [Micromonospora sp. WMMD1082]